MTDQEKKEREHGAIRSGLDMLQFAKYEINDREGVTKEYRSIQKKRIDRISLKIMKEFLTLQTEVDE